MVKLYMNASPSSVLPTGQARPAEALRPKPTDLLPAREGMAERSVRSLRALFVLFGNSGNRCCRLILFSPLHPLPNANDGTLARLAQATY